MRRGARRKSERAQLPIGTAANRNARFNPTQPTLLPPPRDAQQPSCEPSSSQPSLSVLAASFYIHILWYFMASINRAAITSLPSNNQSTSVRENEAHAMRWEARRQSCGAACAALQTWRCQASSRMKGSSCSCRRTATSHPIDGTRAWYRGVAARLAASSDARDPAGSAALVCQGVAFDQGASWSRVALAAQCSRLYPPNRTISWGGAGCTTGMQGGAAAAGLTTGIVGTALRAFMLSVPTGLSRPRRMPQLHSREGGAEVGGTHQPAPANQPAGSGCQHALVAPPRHHQHQQQALQQRSHRHSHLACRLAR